MLFVMWCTLPTEFNGASSNRYVRYIDLLELYIDYVYIVSDVYSLQADKKDLDFFLWLLMCGSKENLRSKIIFLQISLMQRLDSNFSIENHLIRFFRWFYKFAWNGKISKIFNWLKKKKNVCKGQLSSAMINISQNESPQFKNKRNIWWWFFFFFS